MRLEAKIMSMFAAAAAVGSCGLRGPGLVRAEATGKAIMATQYADELTQEPTVRAIFTGTADAQRAKTAQAQQATRNAQATTDAAGAQTAEAIMHPTPNTSVAPCPPFEGPTWDAAIPPDQPLQIGGVIFEANGDVLTTNIPNFGPWELTEGEETQVGGLPNICFTRNTDGTYTATVAQSLATPAPRLHPTGVNGLLS